MTTILDDLAAYIDASTTLTAGTDLFATVMPEAPDNCVAIIPVPGPAPVDTMGTGRPSVDTPRVQVLSRHKDRPDLAESRAREVWNAFGSIGDGVLGGGSERTLRVQVDQSPFLVGRDQNDRPIFGFNSQAWRAT